MKDLPLKLKAFLAILYVFTLLTLIFLYDSKMFMHFQFSYIKIVFFGILLAVAESFRISYKEMAISTGLAVLIASVILFGPLATSIIIVLGFTLRIRNIEGKYQHVLNIPIYQTLYNYCVQIIPVIYSGLAYYKLGGTFDTENLWNKFFLIIIFSIICLLINTFLISILFSILNNKNPLYFFMGNVKLSLLNSLVMTPFGIGLAYMFSEYKYGGVLLIIFPIVLVRYTFYLYLESKNQYIQTVDTLMHAMEARDKYTEGHSRRVSEISTMIAKQLKYDDLKTERIRIASLLHDVGKIGIDDGILNKPGRLTKEEYETIKSHPEIGYNILKDIKNLEDILPIIRNHHERYDGKGYPDGKMPDELSLDVFIVQLADTIDAMVTDRPYRKALTESEVIREITTYSGTQFHPKVVEAYLSILEKRKKAV
ncbi:HD-GYP domain-containing protein [Clostridium sp. YIM B02515]|uniref:HD-GYP domain-containing protein n=1 Tax=Clostridium rhizosphaerae TaxID=2803861 RepID=A0ABS1TCZ1_9CLOT|nr:HD-GYP domain-containing protein [Clostridium rhizosphaerae]MBL4937213.1 HD-GYP domain-containing protein [Clostridium rhizosphaerae]